MSAPGKLWISEAEVLALMDMPEAIAAVKQSLVQEARGKALNMTKTHISWDQGSTLHAVGAAFPDMGFAGTKTWAHTRAGALPVFILFDSNTGSLLAVIEAFALGQFRTGATSGIATERLARDDAREFAIVGTGKQAMTQVCAILAVRPIRRVRVFGRNEGRRAQFAARVEKECGVEATGASTVEETVRDAAIITTVTRATEPILRAAMIAPEAHINAVGAIVPGRFELASDLLERADTIVVDSIAQARELSSELTDFFGTDQTRWAELRSLASIVESEKETRLPSHGVTIFKSLGIGLSDLALAVRVYQRAVKMGMGQSSVQFDKVVAG